MVTWDFSDSLRRVGPKTRISFPTRCVTASHRSFVTVPPNLSILPIPLPSGGCRLDRLLRPHGARDVPARREGPAADELALWNAELGQSGHPRAGLAIWRKRLSPRPRY